MLQLVCSCLNIRIHIKEKSLQPYDVSELHLSAVETDDKFFQQKVAKILLDLGGITKSQNSLCRCRNVGKWQITSCVSCGMDTHACQNSDSGNQLLVNIMLECDKDKITSLMEQSNYSQLFKILLPVIKTPISEGACGLECAIQSKHLESAVITIHQQVNSYLHNEQQAMEERIRNYISQQQIKYVDLQNKVYQDKQAMLNLLLKLQEQDVNEAVVKAITENPNLFLPSTPPPHEVGDSSSSSESTSTKGEQADQVPRTVVHVTKSTPQLYSRATTFNKPIPRRRYMRRNVSQLPRMAQSIDASGVFNMEGIESGDECIPFCISDDGSTDESSAAEDTVIHHHHISHRYATSLPINVPIWAENNHSSGSDDEEEVPPLDDPEQVAASIKALSLSIKDDGTEMFGDLPPSQLTTADLLNSHPLLTGLAHKDR